MGTISTFTAILSQLFWGVTAGALTAALASIAAWLGGALCLTGGACWLWRRRKPRPRPGE